MTTETTTAAQFTEYELSALRFFMLMAWTTDFYKGTVLQAEAKELYNKIVSMQN